MIWFVSALGWFVAKVSRLAIRLAVDLTPAQRAEMEATVQQMELRTEQEKWRLR